MKRLITILTLVALISGISVAAFGATGATATQAVTVGWTAESWVILWIPVVDRTVTLGTIDAGLVPDPETGLMTPITHTGTFCVWVLTNVLGGFTLTVSAANAAGAVPADLARFDIQGGDLVAWFDLSESRTLLSRTDPGLVHAADIAYQYRVDLTDEPGAYSVIVTYTVTAP